MSTPPASVSPTTGFVIAAVAGAIFVALLAARAAHRAARERDRGRTAELFRLFAARLAGSVPDEDLRTAARETTAEYFWAAMEALAGSLRQRERVALSRSLGRNPHAIAERRILTERNSDDRRERAARRLGLLPSARSRRALRKALFAGPESVRFAAARSLAAHRDMRALAWLLTHPRALAGRPQPALSGLLRAFGPRGRAILITALDRGIGVSRVECATLDALGVSRCRSARAAIEARLNSSHPEIRIAAARSLGRLGMGESIPALMVSLADTAWPVRAQAARSLGRLRAAPAVEALALCVADPSWWVRRHAAYALAILGAEGRDALCELVARSSDPYAREMAREALDRGVLRLTA